LDIASAFLVAKNTRQYQPNRYAVTFKKLHACDIDVGKVIRTSQFFRASRSRLCPCTVATTVAAPIDHIWRAYTTPADIMKWDAATADWHTTKATVDLREGGAFSSRMEAKDGSMGFDFAGTYTKIVPHQRIEYDVSLSWWPSRGRR
jgi:Activator of Hsp90 ATPase homolog 1-like protein